MTWAGILAWLLSGGLWQVNLSARVSSSLSGEGTDWYECRKESAWPSDLRTACGGWLTIGAETGPDAQAVGPLVGPSFLQAQRATVRSAPTCSKSQLVGWAGVIAPSGSREALVVLEIGVGSVRWGWLAAEIRRAAQLEEGGADRGG